MQYVHYFLGCFHFEFDLTDINHFHLFAQFRDNFHCIGNRTKFQMRPSCNVWKVHRFLLYRFLVFLFLMVNTKILSDYMSNIVKLIECNHTCKVDFMSGTG